MRVYQFRHARAEDGRNEAGPFRFCNHDFLEKRMLLKTLEQTLCLHEWYLVKVDFVEKS